MRVVQRIVVGLGYAGLFVGVGRGDGTVGEECHGRVRGNKGVGRVDHLIPVTLWGVNRRVLHSCVGSISYGETDTQGYNCQCAIEYFVAGLKLRLLQ